MRLVARSSCFYSCIYLQGYVHTLQTQLKYIRVMYTVDSECLNIAVTPSSVASIALAICPQ